MPRSTVLFSGRWTFLLLWIALAQSRKIRQTQYMHSKPKKKNRQIRSPSPFISAEFSSLNVILDSIGSVLNYYVSKKGLDSNSPHLVTKHLTTLPIFSSSQPKTEHKGC